MTRTVYLVRWTGTDQFLGKTHFKTELDRARIYTQRGFATCSIGYIAWRDRDKVEVVAATLTLETSND